MQMKSIFAVHGGRITSDKNRSADIKSNPLLRFLDRANTISQVIWLFVFALSFFNAQKAARLEIKYKEVIMETNVTTRNLPQMRTIKEIARLGIVSEWTLRRWVQERRIPFITSGNRVLINLDVLCDMLAKGEFWTEKAARINRRLQWKILRF